MSNFKTWFDSYAVKQMTTDPRKFLPYCTIQMQDDHGKYIYREGSRLRWKDTPTDFCFTADYAHPTAWTMRLVNQGSIGLTASVHGRRSGDHYPYGMELRHSGDMGYDSRLWYLQNHTTSTIGHFKSLIKMWTGSGIYDSVHGEQDGTIQTLNGAKNVYINITIVRCELPELMNRVLEMNLINTPQWVRDMSDQIVPNRTDFVFDKMMTEGTHDVMNGVQIRFRDGYGKYLTRSNKNMFWSSTATVDSVMNLYRHRDGWRIEPNTGNKGDSVHGIKDGGSYVLEYRGSGHNGYGSSVWHINNYQFTPKLKTNHSFSITRWDGYRLVGSGGDGNDIPLNNGSLRSSHWQPTAIYFDIINTPSLDGAWDQQYCSGQYIDDEKCAGYCNDNRNQCDLSAYGYCTTHMDTQFCQDAARTNVNSTINYDSIAKNFCQLNPDHSFCSCSQSNTYISSLPETNLAERQLKNYPHCYITDCIEDGYINQALRGNCPDLDICIQDLNANAINQGEISNINMSCTQTNETTTSTNPPPYTSPVETPPEPVYAPQPIEPTVAYVEPSTPNPDGSIPTWTTTTAIPYTPPYIPPVFVPYNEPTYNTPPQVATTPTTVEPTSTPVKKENNDMIYLIILIVIVFAILLGAGVLIYIYGTSDDPDDISGGTSSPSSSKRTNNITR